MGQTAESKAKHRCWAGKEEIALKDIKELKSVRLGDADGEESNATPQSLPWPLLQHHDSSCMEQVDYARQLAELFILLPSLVLKQKAMPL